MIRTLLIAILFVFSANAFSMNDGLNENTGMVLGFEDDDLEEEDDVPNPNQLHQKKAIVDIIEDDEEDFFREDNRATWKTAKAAAGLIFLAAVGTYGIYKLYNYMTASGKTLEVSSDEETADQVSDEEPEAVVEIEFGASSVKEEFAS